MKKTMLFSSALVALAMLASCQKEQMIETPVTATGVTEFTATIESTKTVIGSDGKVTWTAGDEITVTDAESKSAVYVAASDGASTKFTPKDEKTTVGSGPYTATYGNITKQVYDKDGANCPLSAKTTDADSKTLHFSSPYAVVKVTAKSSDGEEIKKVVVEYGNSNSVLDCEGQGVTLTSDGVVFYVAAQPANNANLKVIFYATGKMATKTRMEPISLEAKHLLPVKFESLTWAPTFKAVLNTTGILTFYYDTNTHSGEGDLYDNLPAAATTYTDWGYNNKRQNIKSVVIDSSVDDYKGLTSTAYMFYAMTNASSIFGAEYLDVSNVTNMSCMFQNFGSASTTLTDVPIVSGWNTGEVEKMSSLFREYGKTSTVLDKVPDVIKWNTGKVTDMSYMFYNYGGKNTTFNAIPDVSKWNTDKVTDMSYMFYSYGGNSQNLNAVPIVSEWNTGKVEYMKYMFQDYGKSSTALDKVPNVSGWNVGEVIDMQYLFTNYGNKSPKLKTAPDVSGWNIVAVRDMDYMFQNYGNGSVEFTLDLFNWHLENLPDDGGQGVFDCIAKEFYVKIPDRTSGKTNTEDDWYYGTGGVSITPAYTSSDKSTLHKFNKIKPAN